ncbi:MAG: extracellular solute-binding protein [Christensenellales bacterium]|jgi:putative aldouronate transport system substrate-binding protein
MKKSLALLLTVCLMLVSCAAMAEEPLVPELTRLTLATDGNASTGDPSNLWFWEYCRRELNIDFDVTVTLDNDQFVSLAFASDSIPDIMLCRLSTADIVRYGQEEGMLLDLSPYFTEEYMPNFTALLKEHPEWLSSLATKDGKVYSMPRITGTETITGINITGVKGNFMINQKWLEETGLKSPTTLDELHELLTAFKKLYPDCIPLGGGYSALGEYNTVISPGYLILNALGYTGTDVYGFEVSLRDGKVTIPFGDREVFGEYLKLMNQYYSENLIAKDYFTLDATAVNASLAEGKIGVFPSSVGSGLKEGSNFTDYWGGQPLISAYKSEPSWGLMSNGLRIGQCSVSAECKNIKAAVAWIDWFYNADSTHALLSWAGPSADQTELLYGMTDGYDFDLSTGSRVYRGVKNGKWQLVGELVQGEVAGFTERFGYMVNKSYAGYALSGNEDQYVELVYSAENATQPWQWALYSIQENLMPYLVVDYPSIVFFSEEENTALADLRVSLESYATQEIAKFINGTRPVTDEELVDYFDTLDSMGYQEYLGYYQDYYEQM